MVCSQLMKEPVKAASTHRTSATEDDEDSIDKILTTYCQVVSYLLEIYLDEDVITEADAIVMNYEKLETRPPNTTLRYSWNIYRDLRLV